MSRPAGIDRRRFFPSFIESVERTLRDIDDEPNDRAARFAALTDDEFSRCRPRLDSGVELLGSDDVVQVCRNGSWLALCTFPRDRFTTFLLGSLNGTLTVASLSERVAARYEWPTSQARTEIRRVISTLVEAGACTIEFPL